MKTEFNVPKPVNRRFVLSIISFFLFFTACPSDNGSTTTKTPLILISMDGFRWDYFNKTETTNFDELIQSGSKANALIPVFPTKTFPNHISIVTGRYPETVSYTHLRAHET